MPRIFAYAYRAALLLALLAAVVFALLTGAGSHAPRLPRLLATHVATPSALPSVPPGAVSAPRTQPTALPSVGPGGGALVTP